MSEIFVLLDNKLKGDMVNGVRLHDAPVTLCEAHIGVFGIVVGDLWFLY